MTLPARMQPPDFSGDSPIIPHNALSGSNSVGRENMAHRGIIKWPCMCACENKRERFDNIKYYINIFSSVSK